MSDIDFKKAMEENKVAPYVMKFSNWKWLVLLLGSLMTFGDWYCFDRPAVLEQIMYDEFEAAETNFHFLYAEYSYLYVIYYAPNIIIPLFVGIFMDRFGIRKTLLILSAIGCVGQTLLSINSNDRPNNGSVYFEFLIGRMIYGMGMQSMIFTQVAFITDWFVGKNLNFALGVTNSIPLMGEILNAYLSPTLYHEHADKITCPVTDPPKKCFKGYGMTFYIGMIMVFVCFLLVVAIIVIDYKAEIQLERMKKAWITISADKDAVEEEIIDKPTFNFKDIK